MAVASHRPVHQEAVALPATALASSLVPTSIAKEAEATARATSKDLSGSQVLTPTAWMRTEMGSDVSRSPKLTMSIKGSAGRCLSSC